MRGFLHRGASFGPENRTENRTLSCGDGPIGADLIKDTKRTRETAAMRMMITAKRPNTLSLAFTLQVRFT